METSEYRNLAGKIDALSEDIHSFQEEMRAMLHGDPRDSTKPGLIIRVDRLEQTSGNNKTWIGGILIVLGGLVAELAHRLLK